MSVECGEWRVESGVLECKSFRICYEGFPVSIPATAVSLPSESAFIYSPNDNIVFVLGGIAAIPFVAATYGQSLEAIAWWEMRIMEAAG